MSILDPYLTELATNGIDPTQPLNEAAMLYALTKAERRNLIVYKQGMAQDWLIDAQLWATSHNHRPLTLIDLLTGIVWLATNGTAPAFLKPADLFNASINYQRHQIRTALNHRHTPELPPELWDAPASLEHDYRRAWTHAAILSGDYDTATRTARTALGLPEHPPHELTAPQPVNIPNNLFTKGHNA